MYIYIYVYIYMYAYEAVRIADKAFRISSLQSVTFL